MARKNKPFLYMETHAGAGRYDLRGEDAQRAGLEWQNGVGRLWGREANGLLAPYLRILASLNPRGHLRDYPGSPLIARSLLRPQDRLVLLEARLAEAQQLDAELAEDPRAQVRVGDGYAALQAWLPPPERRGMVLIDPPFERNDEFRQIHEGLQTIHRRFATATVAIWYPLKDRGAVTRFYKSLEKSGLRRLLVAELAVLPEDVVGRLYGSGLVVHNPPWQLDIQLQQLLTEIQPLLALAPGGGSWVRWLVPE